MPYYDEDLVRFSASLPMNEALRLTKGKAGHQNKTKKVDKYILRKAYVGDLDEKLIFRDKAVCVTNHLYLNGCMSSYISELFCTPKLIGTALDEKLGLSNCYAVALQNNKKWKISDYEQVVEIQNLLFLEFIAKKYAVNA